MTNLWIPQTNVMAWAVIYDESLGLQNESLGLQTEVIFGAAEHDNRL